APVEPIPWVQRTAPRGLSTFHRWTTTMHISPPRRIRTISRVSFGANGRSAVSDRRCVGRKMSRQRVDAWMIDEIGGLDRPLGLLFQADAEIERGQAVHFHFDEGEVAVRGREQRRLPIRLDLSHV